MRAAPRTEQMKSPAGAKAAGGASALPPWIASPGAAWIAARVAVFGALQYPFVFGLPFVADDYWRGGRLKRS